MKRVLFSLGFVACASTAVRLPPAGPCAGVREITYTIDPAFSPEDREDIERALVLWSEGTRGHLRFTRRSPAAMPFVRAPSIRALSELNRTPDRGIIGLYLDDTIYIVGGEYRVEDTAAHEIGHWLGLQHNESATSLMRPVGGSLANGRIPGVDLLTFCLGTP